jgi:hypothetical protein
MGVSLATCPEKHMRFEYFEYLFISVILPSMMLFEAPRRLP